VAYLARVLRCKWETARDALLVLEHLGMLRHELPEEGNLQLWLNKPTRDHLALFQNAEPSKRFSAPACTIGVEEARPMPAVANVTCRRYTFEDVLQKVEKLTEYPGDEAEDLAWKLVEQTDDLEQICLDLGHLQSQRLTERLATLEKMVLEDDVPEDVAA